MENKISKNERALAKEGQLIEVVDRLKTGDIIGINHYRNKGQQGRYQDARIYFVDRVDMEPHLKGMTLLPTAYLKRPHVGVRFSDSLEVVYAYIHVPMAAESCMTAWSPMPKDSSKWQEEDLKTIEELFGKQDEKTYLIRQGLLYELGQSIPSVELPSWAFMFQSNNPQETKDICAAVKQEFENAKAVHSRIKHIFEQH